MKLLCAFDAAIPWTNELRYPTWLLAAQLRVGPSASGRGEVPSPAPERPYEDDKRDVVRHYQVFPDFVRRSHVFQDGPAKTHPRLVESSEVTDLASLPTCSGPDIAAAGWPSSGILWRGQ